MKKTALLAAILVQVSMIAPVRASTVDVSIATCYLAGEGQATVPADSTVSVRFGWAESTRGALQHFLQAQTVIATVNSSPISGASNLWDRAVAQPPDIFVTWWRYTDGTLASAGDQVNFTFQVLFTQRYREPDGTVYERGSTLVGPLSCTITAV